MEANRLLGLGLQYNVFYSEILVICGVAFIRKIINTLTKVVFPVPAIPITNMDNLF